MISMATNGIINQWNKGNKLKGHTQKVIQYKELYRDLQYYLTESHRVEEIAHQAEHVLFTLNTLEKTQPNIPTKLLHACREDTKKQIEEQSTLYVLGVQVSETPTPPPQEKNEEQV